MPKCEFCKIKKVSPIISYSCRCAYTMLCANCRHPEKHNCSFDFKEYQKNILLNDNPKIVSYKIDKI